MREGDWSVAFYMRPGEAGGRLPLFERSGFTAPDVREVVCLYQGHEWCQ